MRAPAPDASTNGYVYSGLPPVSVLVPPTLSPWLLSTWHYPQRRLTPTMHPRSSTQSKSSMCISSKTTNPPCPAYLLFAIAPVRAKRDTKRALGKQVMIGLDSVIHRSGGFRTSKAAREAVLAPMPWIQPQQ